MRKTAIYYSAKTYGGTRNSLSWGCEEKVSATLPIFTVPCFLVENISKTQKSANDPLPVKAHVWKHYAVCRSFFWRFFCLLWNL